jgi:hypothetical protein
MLVGWVNRRQQSVIEYLPVEIRAVCEQPGTKRILALRRKPGRMILWG